MSRYKNWTGYTYNSFTVLCEDKDYNDSCKEKIKRGEIKRFNKKWLCRCECGNIISISATQIAKNKPNSCGCKSIKKIEHMIGREFGDWVVLERDLDKENAIKNKGLAFHDYWICRCNCGNIKSVSGTHLRRGSSTNCGCKHGEKISLSKAIDITGKRFGHLVALYSTGEKTHSGFKWVCKCDCGENDVYTVYDLRLGKITECKECRKHGFNSVKSYAVYRRAQGKIKKEGSLYNILSEKFSEEQLRQIWSVKNKFSPKELTKKSHQDIYLICPQCGEEYATNALSLYNRVYDIVCPSCLSEKVDSSLERAVKEYLRKNLGLKTLHEAQCTLSLKNPKTGCLLKFDNEIPDLKILIEVHGIQHYKIIKYSNWVKNTTPEEWLKELQWRDNYKKEKAIELGYNYLCLSYKEVLSGEYKTKIDNFIREVKENGNVIRQNK